MKNREPSYDEKRDKINATTSDKLLD